MHWLHRHRLIMLAAIAAFWTGLVLLAHFFPSIPVLSTISSGERSFEDMLRRQGRKTPTHSDFVFVGIDQTSLSLKPIGEEETQAWASNRAFQLMMTGQFPWSREVWALLLDRLIGAGARLVMFDMVFDKPNDGDPPFRAALDRYHDKVIIGANFDFSQLRDNGNVVNVPPNTDLIPAPQMYDDRVGYVVFFPDADQKIRSAVYSLVPFPGEEPVKSLSARALEKLGHGGDVPGDLKSHLIRFSAADAYKPVPLWELFDPRLWQTNYQKKEANFKDKIVIVGASSQVAHDVFPTPLGPETPGPLIHFHALAAALDHEFLHDTPVRVELLLVLIGGLTAWALVAFLRHPLVCLIALFAVAAADLVLAWIVYNRAGLLLAAVPPLSAFLPTGLFGLGFEYFLERLEKLRTRRTLERYVSRNLVKEILENPGSYYSSMLGSRKPVTVLFSDLVGFTTLVEKSDPSVLVPRLNKYLSAMVPVVFNNGGTLDKFIGDAIMAVWGNVSSRGEAEDAKAAIRAALGMRREMAKLNTAWKTEGLDPFAFGVGINHGDAVVGNIGSYEPHERLDPTVIGDAVNLASRLEGLTRTYGVDILIGRSATELAKDEFHFRSVARVQVKGKTEPAEVFTLIGARNEDVDAEFLKWLQVYEEAIAKFRKRDFKDAKILFSHFLEFYPDDSLGRMYLASALEYETAPPDEAWNAVEVFKKK